MAWPALAERAAMSVLAVPLGSTEQHGPHLPLSTDSDIAVALADRLASALSGVLVAPPLSYGSSGEHAGFPGTLSLGQQALQSALVELVRSADAFQSVVIVSGHGGNAAPLGRAVATLVSEGRRVLAWAPAIDGDLHAGRTETSMMLALAPELVDVASARAGDRRPLAQLIGPMQAGGVVSVSPNGVLGDPAGASADEGRRLLDVLAADLVATVRAATERWGR
jgi:mycofactocin system creatininase family protein